MQVNSAAIRDRPTAVVWADERHALVAGTVDDGRLEVMTVDHGTEPEAQYLAHVVHEIGDRERVMLVGPGDVRLALEREFVRITHRPDRLVPAPFGASMSGREILSRLERLAA